LVLSEEFGIIGGKEEGISGFKESFEFKRS
jgi:hypothetical protein